MSKQIIIKRLLIITAIVAVLFLLFIKPIQQEISYHKFSDENLILGIPNFWNVISNLPFLLVGFLGVFKLKNTPNFTAQYLVFFIGVALVSIGSGFYHLNPNNDTLIWDRLPMTIAFMALFSIIISEFICLKLGKRLFVPLLIVGLLSVVYWAFYDDLRFYILIQFYPIVTIPIILMAFKPKYNLIYGYWLLLVFYIIAKLLELFDFQVHNTIHFMSGHSLKHIAAAIGIVILLYSYLKRKKNSLLSKS